MASCANLSGYSSTCKGTGGIKKIVIFEFKGLDTTGSTLDSDTYIITGLTVNNGFSGYSYDFLKNNSSATEPNLGDGVLSRGSFQPTILLVFNKTTNLLLKEINELSKTDLVAIVQDFNNGYRIYGLEKGINLTASDGSNSGLLSGDFNGETVILQGEEPDKAPFIDISATSGVDSQILQLFGF